MTDETSLRNGAGGGMTSDVSMPFSIYWAYGEGLSVTKILLAIRKDKGGNNHPKLRIWCSSRHMVFLRRNKFLA